MKKGSVTWTFDEISNVHVKILQVLGILPFKDRRLSFIGTRFLVIYFHIINLLYVTMLLGYGVRMLARHSFEFDSVSKIIVGVSLSLRYLMLFGKRSDLRRLMQSCRELWKNLVSEESQIMRHFERKLHYYRNFLIWNSVVGVTLFVMTAHFISLPPDTINGTEKRALPFGFYVDIQEESAFTIILIYQALICYNIIVILAGTETTALFFIFMACGYLRSVDNRLSSMTKFLKKKDPNGHGRNGSIRYQNKLSVEDILKCAKFHQMIMKFCEEIEHFARSLYMIAVLCSSYNLSLVGIRLLQKDEYIFSYIATLILNLLQLFVCQWGPEHLLNESKSIANAAYFASLVHSQYNEKANKMLLLIILRAQKPVQLTASGFINLSMETFGHLMKSAFSFFTVVNSFST